MTVQVHKYQVDLKKGRYAFQLPENATKEDTESFPKVIDYCLKNNVPLIINSSVKIIDLNQTIEEAPLVPVPVPVAPTVVAQPASVQVPVAVPVTEPKPVEKPAETKPAEPPKV